jgi:hypothetical protein
MTKRRKPRSGDPREHPGKDTLWVMWPDVRLTAAQLAGIENASDSDEAVRAFVEAHPLEVREEEVTRDEFVRRMAGCPDPLRLLHESGRDTRVISLMDVDAITQWCATEPGTGAAGWPT